jgi:hypothetical protein
MHLFTEAITVTARGVFFLAALSVMGCATATSTLPAPVIDGVGETTSGIKQVPTIMLAEKSPENIPQEKKSPPKVGETPKKTKTAGKYVVLPFSRVLTPETRGRIGKLGEQPGLAKALADKLGGKGMMASKVSPMDHHSFDGLYLTIDVKPPEPVEKQLDTIRNRVDASAAGILLGHLVEDLAKKELRLTVRYCAASCRRVTVVYDDSWGSYGVTEEALEKALDCVVKWIGKGAKETNVTCPRRATVLAETGSAGNDASAGSSEAVFASDGAQQSAKPPLEPKKLLPTIEPRASPLDAMTLEEVYGMIYDQEFYAHSWSGNSQHEQAVAAAANGRDVTLEEFKEDLSGHFRNAQLKDSESCWNRVVISEPLKRSGRSYRLCFDPVYQFPIGRKMYCKRNTEFRLGMAKSYHRNSANLLLGTQNRGLQPDQRYRFPTIDELFSLTKYLPKPPVNGTLFLWSSTPAPGGDGFWWGIQMTVVPKGNRSGYKPTPISISIREAAYVFPVRTCP